MVLVDGDPFRVTPGADFDFAATIDVPGKSLGAGYVSVIFLGDAEVARESLWFTALPLELPAVTTNEDGGFRVPLRGLRPGRYDLDITYAGDIDHWAANQTERVRVK